MKNCFFDKQGLLKRCLGDEQIVNVLLESFFQTSEKKIRDLPKAIVNKNNAEIKAIGHFLKGSATNINAHALADIAEEIEMAGKNSDYATADKYQSELVYSLKQLKQIIDIKE